ncbi:glutathione-disulfide reductase [Litoribrevibacter albus]|uniref:Glutathione reductase n=1 Tax=Litoribrevibacter albus TaxID=1473156 RepID=A0AA37W6Q4_9GAMM|nr:glutathione-disulfide reductase [Litoribrevibacter albus]GLQ31840.1 glutathione reductase [Litoribrevibacter albus]
MKQYDLFVIGAGSGGVRAARMAAAQGAKVAIAESRYFGGTCVNVGCVPKKLFVYASEFSRIAESSKRFGWDIQVNNFNWPTLLQNKNSEIERLNGIYSRLLDNSNVEVYEGEAKLIGNHCVQVNDQQIKADKILIATGGWPVKPDIQGSELAITSNEFFFLDALPKRVLVVGGGYIAVEFAGILNGLGVNTTLSYRGDKLLRGFDEDVRNHLTEELAKSGMTLDLSRSPTSIEKVGNEYRVSFSEGESISTDLVVFATGRKPLTSGLGIENTAVALDSNGAVIVNEFFETAESGVFALGDVINRVQLTPVALHEAMRFVANEFKGSARTGMDYKDIASAVFSQPNVATVGLSEDEAKRHFSDVEIYRSSFRALKETISGSDAKTLMKIVVDKASDKVLGMHMVGDHAGEVIQGFAAAIKMGITKTVLDSTVGIHPTSAEEFVTMRDPVS